MKTLSDMGLKAKKLHFFRKKKKKHIKTKATAEQAEAT